MNAAYIEPDPEGFNSIAIVLADNQLQTTITASPLVDVDALPHPKHMYYILSFVRRIYVALYKYRFIFATVTANCE